MVPGVGPQTSRALLERFGSAGRVLSASRAELIRESTGVGPKLAEQIVRARRDFDAEAELELCRRNRGPRDRRATIRTTRRRSRTSPTRRACSTSKGRLEPSDQLAIAIVGSRRCTPYGVRIAERLAAALARTGFTVVSGLARGIDAAAHRGAIKAGGRTIAVLANGLASVYPPEHDDLARERRRGRRARERDADAAEPAGRACSPSGTGSSPGSALGVVVVEATPRSGSLSTARHAMEQNREVFAVPGPVDSLSSRGCHRLIRDGARLVETVDDILEELGPLIAKSAPIPTSRRCATPPSWRSPTRSDRSWATSTTTRPASTS